MEATLIPVKPRVKPIATFAFRGVNVAVEVNEDGGVSVKCPVCRELCGVNLKTHAVVINLQTKKATTIYPSVSCPGPFCGFRVVVVRGMAFEVEPNRKPEEPPRALEPGEKRCIECGKPFKPGCTVSKSRNGSFAMHDDDEGGRQICQRCVEPSGAAVSRYKRKKR